MEWKGNSICWTKILATIFIKGRDSILFRQDEVMEVVCNEEIIFNC
jgi:hypothetical protein